MFGAGSINGPMQPAGAASMRPGHSLAFSPTMPPQAATAARLVRRQFSRERNEGTGRVDAGAEPKLKLGAILGLISGLIADDERRAAHLVLENLASSNLADCELSCTDSVFKGQLASLLSTHTADMSHNALATIQRRIRENADRHGGEIQGLSAGVLEASDTTGPDGRSNFRFCRPHGRLLLTASPAASSALHNGDAAGQSQNRASLRHEDVRVPEARRRLQCHMGDFDKNNWLRSQACSQKCTFYDSAGQLHNVTVRLPPGFGDCWSWPLLMYIHGAGGTGMFQHGAQLEGLQVAEANFIIIEPTCTWHWQEEPDAWIDELFLYFKSWNRVNCRKTYVVGFSQGGMSTWECSARLHNRVTACVPVGAHHDPGRTQILAQCLRSLPIWAWHSYADKRCPISDEIKLWDSIVEHPNNQLHVRTCRGLSHMQVFSWALNETADIYRWLLSLESPE